MSQLEVTFAIVGMALTVLGILVTILSVIVQFVTGMFPLSFIEEQKKQKLLTEKFSRGPYNKTTIERSTKYYIWPKCSNLDPAQETEIRHALMATQESLLEKVDQFLDSHISDLRRHLLILADSGMGKTSFVLNYYFYNSRRPKNKKHHLVIIPLGIKNSDELINQIPNQEETILFLDAFDEDVKAIKDHRERIIELMEICKQYKKIVITCRTQFFPKGEEIPVETGIIKLGPRKAGDKGIYEFWKLYLSPFADDDVKKYLKKKYPLWNYSERKKALDIALKIPLLSVRPMLLAHIPDILESKQDVKFIYQLYEIMVAAWLERESRWADKKSLRDFSERLAFNIYTNRNTRGTEGVPYSELPILAQDWGIELKPWQLGGRSLLNRDADDNYKFAHRSIMEYLFICRILRNKELVKNIDFTGQMLRFFSEMLEKGSLMELLPSLSEEWAINFSIKFLPQKNWVSNNRWTNLDLAIDYWQEKFKTLHERQLMKVRFILRKAKYVEQLTKLSYEQYLFIGRLEKIVIHLLEARKVSPRVLSLPPDDLYYSHNDLYSKIILNSKIIGYNQVSKTITILPEDDELRDVFLLVHA